MDLVTVAIPLYNHQNYIIDCLESILKEDYPNLEICIIDDGSKDQSVELVNTWHLKHPNVALTLISRANKGQLKTLNELIRMARGKYICLLASDDMLCNNGISKRLTHLRKHDGKKAVIGDAVVIDNRNQKVYDSAIEQLYRGNKKNYSSDELLRWSIIHEWSIPGPVLLFEKDLFDEIGPYPEDLVAEDLYFYLRVIGKGLLVFLNEPIALYRIHDANTWRNPNLNRKISVTFIKSYLRNIQYYRLKYKVRILKKVLGRMYLFIKG